MTDRILVIRFSSLGDILLSSPTVLNLRLAFPHAHISYLTKAAYRSIVGRFEGLDEVLTLPDGAGTFEYLRLLWNQHDRHFTHIVDLHANPRSNLARRMLTSDQQVVYPKRRAVRQAMVRRYDKTLPESPLHTIDAYNRTLQAINLPAVADRPLFRPAPEPNGSIEIGTSRPRVVIAPGAAHQPKQFGVKRFASIAAQLQSEYDAHIIWAGTSGERQLDDIEVDLDRNALTELIDHPLERLAGLIADSALTIANDSGLAHLASAVGTPVIALFGPTHPALGFAPRGQFDRIIQVDEFCRPCSLHGKKPCYREEQFCFTRIADADVLSVAAELLERHTTLQPALFIDRDGTLIKEKHFLKNPDEIEFESGAVHTLRAARGKGYRLVILSNQSGVARGLMSISDVERVNARLLELLATEHIEIDGVYFCPYHPEGSVTKYARSSRDRKPSPGMVEAAAEQLNIDTRRSLVVGDKRSDLHLAAVIGARGCLVRTGYGVRSEQSMSEWERKRFTVYNSIEEIVRDL